MRISDVSSDVCSSDLVQFHEFRAMQTEFVDLDVRPILEAGGEPFGEIMGAIAALGPEQGLRLLAPFKPAPLFDVLAGRGFQHQAPALAGGDWEVLFWRADAATAEGGGGAGDVPPPEHARTARKSVV